MTGASSSGCSTRQAGGSSAPAPRPDGRDFTPGGRIMTRYALAAVVAALIGARADAQVVYSSGYTYPGNVYVSPSSVITYSPYAYSYGSLYSGSYYTPGYAYSAPGYPAYS